MCIIPILILASGTNRADMHTLRTAEQQRYFDVRQAIRTQKPEQYLSQLQEMEKYPLYPYLYYQHHIRNLPENIDGFLTFSDSLKSTPLYPMARHHYLSYLGRYKRWKEFLAISPKEPKNDHLKCYYFRAQAQEGNPDIAWKGAEKMWLTPHSQEEQCDILFNEWDKSGFRTDQHIWQRMLLAFGIRRGSFINYLTKQLDYKRYKDAAKLLMSIYHQPRQIGQGAFLNRKHTTLSIDMIYYGLKKIAYSDLGFAIRTYQKYVARELLPKNKAAVIYRFMMYRILITEEKQLRPLVDDYLKKHPSDKLIESRLRWAIHEQNWDDIGVWLTRLSKKAQNEDRWQYWLARFYQEKQQFYQAQEILERIATKRSFYGFVCAQELKLDFPLNTKSVQPDNLAQRRIRNSDTANRIEELFQLGFKTEARIEWLYLLKNSSKTERQQLALFAQEKNWPHFTIEASIQGKIWDALDMRFPLAWREHFERYAKKHRVPVSDLQAIARRESAFNRFAQSPVGALGLMQIMPRTARETARRLGIRYKGNKQLHDPQTNVHIGSAYYYQLIKQFDQNRIFALASYNAGPSRVKRWRKESDGKLDVMSFIETIPFRETREYVQSVLTYRVIYQIFNEDEPQLFSDKELTRLY